MFEHIFVSVTGVLSMFENIAAGGQGSRLVASHDGGLRTLFFLLL